MKLQLALVGLLVALVVLDFLAARAILRSGWFTKRQVIAQIIIVCLVPLLGAIFAFVFLRSQQPVARQTEGADSDNWRNATGATHADHFAP